MLPLTERYTRKISKEEINELPLVHYTGKVTLVQDNAGLSHALNALNNEKIIGFDTETRPNFQKGVCNLPSIIQLATANEVFILHLGWIDFSQGIRELLADASHLKTGVAVRDDIKGLQKIAPFRDAGVIDLGEKAHQVHMETRGLRTLAANLLGIRISKAMQCSNWSRQELSPQQISYAATDAWISREIHLRFVELGLFEGKA